MELESKEEQWQSPSPSTGEGLLRAANKEYLNVNNVNYHNTNTLQSLFYSNMIWI